MNRQFDICKHCEAMIPVKIRANEEPKWFCKDSCYASSIGFWIDSNCGIKQWAKKEVPPKCRCYAEYFIRECNE